MCEGRIENVLPEESYKEMGEAEEGRGPQARPSLCLIPGGGGALRYKALTAFPSWWQKDGAFIFLH